MIPVRKSIYIHERSHMGPKLQWTYQALGGESIRAARGKLSLDYDVRSWWSTFYFRTGKLYDEQEESLDEEYDEDAYYEEYEEDSYRVRKI